MKIEQLSIQHDHIHLLVRTGRRSQYQNFFRVVAGQIAQRFEYEGLFAVTDTPHTQSNALATGRDRRQNSAQKAKKTGNNGSSAQSKPKLWKYRPFTRVIRGYRSYKIIKDYIQLNEQEVLGKIPYRKTRLKGMSCADWEILWS